MNKWSVRIEKRGSKIEIKIIRQESEELQNEVDEHENEDEKVDVDEKVIPLILGEFSWQKIR